MTSSLIVLAFDTMDEAEKVHEALVQGKKEGLLTIQDFAVVVKDADGKVEVKNQVSSGTWMATGVGGALGLLIGTIFFPIGGLVLGLAGGALVGKFMDLGVDGKFVKQVGGEIQPGTSALFVLVDKENPGPSWQSCASSRARFCRRTCPASPKMPSAKLWATTLPRPGDSRGNCRPRHRPLSIPPIPRQALRPRAIRHDRHFRSYHQPAEVPAFFGRHDRSN